MIHFTCDSCRRVIDIDDETRYVARVEVYAAVDEGGDGLTDETDHLQEIEELLERVDELDGEPDAALYNQVRYDLCEECRERFLRNPLGLAGTRRIGFSKN